MRETRERESRGVVAWLASVLDVSSWEFSFLEVLTFFLFVF